MVHSDWMGAGGEGGQRIYLRQNKGERCLLNTLQGSGGQHSKAEIVGHEAVVRGYSDSVE